MREERVRESRLKEERLRRYLAENDYTAAIIGRLDNFAWFTGGGSAVVITGTENAFATVVVTQEKKYLIALVADGERIMDEEVDGQGFQYVPLRWYEKSQQATAMELAGKGRILSDLPIPGADCQPDVFYQLHYPLTEPEMKRYRELARTTEEILATVAEAIQPGMTELEIQGMLWREYAIRDIFPDVMLVGSDERLSKYRHFNTSAKPVEKYIILSPVARFGGLHANVARTVSFGEPPAEIRDKYRAVCQIEAAVFSMSRPGVRFAEILEVEKALYREAGYPEEWRNHFQGGITGYMVSDPTLCMNPEAVVSADQAFDWFITITGTKGEELLLNPGGAPEVASVTGRWPTERFSYKGESFDLPAILVR